MNEYVLLHLLELFQFLLENNKKKTFISIGNIFVTDVEILPRFTVK